MVWPLLMMVSARLGRFDLQRRQLRADRGADVDRQLGLVSGIQIALRVAFIAPMRALRGKSSASAERTNDNARQAFSASRWFLFLPQRVCAANY